MQDKNAPGQDEDFLDEDFEIETLDDEEDLAAEDWDDFDDAGEAAVPAGGDKTASEAVKPAVSKQKTFLQKNFNLIVIVIGVIAGGFVLASTLGGGSNQSSSMPQAEMTDENLAMPDESALGAAPSVPAEDTEIPPMPTPMDSAASGADLELADASPQLPGAAPETQMPEPESVTLTPMPAEHTDSEVELAPLEIEPVPAEAPTDASVNESPALTFGDAPEAEPAVEMEAPEMPVPAEIIAEPALEAPPAEAPSAVAAMPNADFAALEGKFSELNDLILAKIDSNDVQMRKLAESVEALQKQVVAMAEKQATAEAAPTPNSEPSPASKEEPKEIVAAPKSKPAVTTARKKSPSKPAARTAQTQSRSQNWELRSAQPGKAVLAARDTGDMKAVEVGDTVKGIGTITAIGQENGSWVVRGTQGQISR